MNSLTLIIFQAFIYPGFITMILLVILTQWYTRKITGRIQFRRGPTRTGPGGVLQPLADFIKLLSKEDVVNKYGLRTSPLAIIVLAIGSLISLSLITPLAITPFYAPYDFIIIAYIMLLAPLALAYLALSTPNPYSSIASGRYLALLISADPAYIATHLVPVILATKYYDAFFSTYLTSTVSHLLWITSLTSFIAMSISTIAGFLSLMAVLLVKPFDFPEAETELYWGLFTELGGPRLAMGFFLKFLEKIMLPLIYVMLFLGGVWPAEPSNWFLSAIVVLVKYMAVLTLITVIDNSMPRYRPDQGVRFLWKYCYTLTLLSLALAILS